WYERTYASSEFKVQSSELKVPVTQNSELLALNSALAPFYQLLAYHWGKAGVVAKAVDYLERAGRHALTISAVREARRLFAEALELLEAAVAPGERESQAHLIALTRLLGDADRQLGDFAAALKTLERSLALARAADDHVAMIDALALLGLVATDTG